MTQHRPREIEPRHVVRLAVVYVRQSCRPDVGEQTGSTAHQRDLQKLALRWGWQEGAIQVIDDDLGSSGASADREGFKRIRELVTHERVGMLLASDKSRLTRSSRDLASLLRLCRDTGTLVAINGSIVDLDDPGDCLLARMRAGFAEYENRQRTRNFTMARYALARRGYAVSRAPTGYVVIAKGKWGKDDDPAVRQRIEDVFRLFETLGTLGKVVRFLAANGLKLPIRTRAGGLRWGRPSRTRIYNFLTEPAFMGWYVYGRRPKVRGAGKDKRRKTSREDWIVVPDHHEPYIAPEDWHRNNSRLRSNAFCVRQPARNGAALCQGLLRCGRCGHNLRVYYYKTTRSEGHHYRCNLNRALYGLPICWNVPGRGLDETLVAEVLRSVTPTEVEAVLAGGVEVNEGYEATLRERQTELERARYEARLAEKRFKEVDPENRLVAAGLEKDFEQALEKVRHLERHHLEEPLVRPLDVTPDDIEEIRRLTVDLPHLFWAPSTTNEDRKTLIRFFVNEVRVVEVSSSEVEVDIHWVGGAASHHAILRPQAGANIACQLAAQGLTPTDIAAELNRRGVRTMTRRGPYTPSAVRKILEVRLSRPKADC